MAHFRGGVVVVRQVGPGLAAPLVPSPRSQTESWALSHGGLSAEKGQKERGQRKVSAEKAESQCPLS